MSAIAAWNANDKKALVRNLAELMETNLKEILKSAEAAYGGATHGDAIAKSKYDTHGLELSYLAGSQFERAELLKAEIASLLSQKIILHGCDDPIQGTAVVELIDHDRNLRRVVFISTYGAGRKLHFKAEDIHVLSPVSPLGSSLLDCEIGDEIATGPEQSHYFEISAFV